MSYLDNIDELEREVIDAVARKGNAAHRQHLKQLVDQWLDEEAGPKHARDERTMVRLLALRG